MCGILDNFFVNLSVETKGQEKANKSPYVFRTLDVLDESVTHSFTKFVPVDITFLVIYTGCQSKPTANPISIWWEK